MQPIEVTHNVTLPPQALSMATTCATGPGGQHVNKTESVVELRCDLSLCPDIRDDARLRIQAANRHRLDANGSIFVVASRFRSQPRNLDDACERLAAIIRAGLVPPKPRLETRVPRREKAKRREEKGRTGEKKQLRQRPVERD